MLTNVSSVRALQLVKRIMLHTGQDCMLHQTRQGFICLARSWAITGTGDAVNGYTLRVITR